MFYALPAKMRSMLGTSLFRLGGKVPTDGVNMAFVQSQAMDIAENVQIVKYYELLDDNQLEDSEEFDLSPSTYQQDFGTTDIVISDRQDADGNFFRYKAYSVWWHVEGYDYDGIAASPETELESNSFHASITGRWKEYLGSKIRLAKDDGTDYDGSYKIYVRPFNVLGVADVASVRNAFKVLVYMDGTATEEGAHLVYDKGEIRGSGVTTVTGFEQEFDEELVLLSIIPEAPTLTSRRYAVLSGTRFQISDGSTGFGSNKTVTVFFEKSIKVNVTVPTVEDNHAPWFPLIRKGLVRKIFDYSYVDANQPLFSVTMQLVLPDLVRNYNLASPVTVAPASDAKLDLFYSTEDYSRNRTGSAYSQGMALAHGEGAVVSDGEVNVGIGPIMAHMPIYIEVEEYIPQFDQVGNRPASLVGEETRRYIITNDDSLLSYEETTGRPVPLQYETMEILVVDRNRIVFDSKIRGVEKVFGFSPTVQAYYYYKQREIPYTGFQDRDEFNPCDVNPSVGHVFAGEATKPLSYDNFTGLWRSGISHINSTRMRIYDAQTNDEVPSGDYLGNPGTDLSRGIFDISNVDTTDSLLIWCAARGLPAYLLFTTPILIKMLPVRAVLRSETDGKTVPYEILLGEEFIQHSTVQTAEALPADELAIAGISVIPNTIYGQNTIFDTRSRGGGLKESFAAQEGERHFWDIGFMDGKAYTGNMVLVVEVPRTIRNRYLEEGWTEADIDNELRLKAMKYAAKGSLIMIEYV